MPATLELLYAPLSEPVEDLEAWAGAQADLAGPTGVQALAGGLGCRTLGLAFASGYQAALRALFPARGTIAALCATEQGGGHPRAMRCALTAEGTGLRLRGEKSFVTLGTRARHLAVVAREGEDPQGRPRLRIAWLDTNAPGVRMQERPPLPFAPDIPHATLSLDTLIQPEQLLPGDGYLRYLKPFRSVEDVHVFLAALGSLLRLAREHDWPRPLQEELMAQAALWLSLAAGPWDSPQLHLALSGALRGATALLQRLPWSQLPPELATAWRRDLPLLAVASRVRDLRAQRAWRDLTGEPT